MCALYFTRSLSKHLDPFTYCIVTVGGLEMSGKAAMFGMGGRHAGSVGDTVAVSLQSSDPVISSAFLTSSSPLPVHQHHPAHSMVTPEDFYCTGLFVGQHPLQRDQ